MQVRRLDHFTLRTPLMEETRQFFEQVAELVVGIRPLFQFSGYWLYSGDTAIMHLASYDPADKRLAMYFGDRHLGEDTGGVDHIALRCAGLPDFEERLVALCQAYRGRTVPALKEHQVFVNAPGSSPWSSSLTPKSLLAGMLMRSASPWISNDAPTGHRSNRVVLPCGKCSHCACHS